MGDYQDRVDIDRLYSLIWDNEANQLSLVKKEEMNILLSEINEKIETLFALYEELANRESE